MNAICARVSASGNGHPCKIGESQPAEFDALCQEKIKRKRSATKPERTGGPYPQNATFKKRTGSGHLIIQNNRLKLQKLRPTPIILGVPKIRVPSNHPF